MEHQNLSDQNAHLNDYRFITVEIFYNKPIKAQGPEIYVWQSFDLPPKLPKFNAFFEQFKQGLEGEVFSVKVIRTDEIVSKALPIVTYEGGDH